MELLGVHHVAVVVGDTDTAVTFYTDVLGLERMARPDFGSVGGAWLRAGSQELHLIERPGSTEQRGQHVAFRVADVAAAAAELTARGIEVRLLDPMTNGTRQAILRDPDGNVVELTQPGA